MAFFSVVIPLYNKGDYIARAVGSVLSQEGDGISFELIIIDDGSTDKGPEVVRGFNDPRIRLITQPNSGVSVARNRGIAEAKAETVAFLDADDIWKPDFLKTISRLMEKFPEAGAYATSYDINYPDGRVESLKFKDIPSVPWEGIIPDYFGLLLEDFPVWTSAVAIPIYIFKEIGGFLEGMRFGQDQEMWLRIAIKYPIVYTNSPKAVYFFDLPGSAWQQYMKYGEFKSDLLTRIEQILATAELSSSARKGLMEVADKRRLIQVSLSVMAGETELAKEYLSNVKSRKFLIEKMWWLFWANMPPGLTDFTRKSKNKLKAFFSPQNS